MAARKKRPVLRQNVNPIAVSLKVFEIKRNLPDIVESVMPKRKILVSNIIGGPGWGGYEKIYVTAVERICEHLPLSSEARKALSGAEQEMWKFQALAAVVRLNALCPKRFLRTCVAIFRKRLAVVKRLGMRTKSISEKDTQNMEAIADSFSKYLDATPGNNIRINTSSLTQFYYRGLWLISLYELYLFGEHESAMQDFSEIRNSITQLIHERVNR